MINEDDSDLEDDYPFDKNEIMSGFENFKKELPQDVLEKDFNELMPELGLDSDIITEDSKESNKDLEIETIGDIDIDETGYDASNEASVSDNTIEKDNEILEINKNAVIDNIEELNDDDLDIDN